MSWLRMPSVPLRSDAGADTPRGAKASATTYSLIETAKANGVEPFAYLHHVLQHIGNARTVEDIEALLPWNTPVKKMQ